MAIRKILTYPDKFLRQPTKPVLNIDEVIQELIDDMTDTMYEAPGVGLAERPAQAQDHQPDVQGARWF